MRVTRRSVIKFLQEVPLFTNCSAKELRSIIEIAKNQTFKAETRIVAQGDRATSFYLILDGKVAIRRDGHDLAELQVGQFFGEMALLNDESRSADVIAIEKTQCLILTRWALHSILLNNPQIAIRIIGELARRLRDTNRKLTE
ncbi:MAG: cyclic nucleotide-binding domain-containing protein [Candidatus Bipolaricaulia bacterium]